MHKFAKSIIAILLTLTLIVGAFAWFATDLISKPFQDVTLVEKGDTNIDITAGIGAHFEEIAELSVEEYQFTNVGKYDEQGIKVLKVGVPLTGKSFLATYDGVIKAGVDDMSTIQVEQQDDDRKIALSVPEPVITSAYIDPATITVYDQSMNPFNQFKIEDMSQFLAMETKNAEELAIKKGILDRAKTRTAELLTTQVKAVTNNTDKADYEVVINWR
ncbi:hypothetical protein CKALI_11940 [Corynebacterium kalinowskii]|uniref:DUF4230 domain-containing protein n=1 Tax=Corynebacterium kalinowskii TaxID=2675216 RepID=A0A6B8VWZ9_9CORY|nr:DUF4230 domain-containing protein [Corynebacterium kalinowskii]QGU03226.1 hypothetical protein CKALI_11940 [Corynebacterium kalinowskii]